MAELDTSQGGGKHKGGKKKLKKASTRVDLTPMVDLGFLLVTFFMLTTTFSKPQTMEINMPIKDDTVKPEEQQAVKESNAMVIIAGANNTVYYYFGNTKDDPKKTTYAANNGIRDVLYDRVAQVPGLTVLIKPMPEATYKNVVDLLDEMSITKCKRYALVDVDQTDKDIIKKLL